MTTRAKTRDETVAPPASPSRRRLLRGAASFGAVSAGSLVLPALGAAEASGPREAEWVATTRDEPWRSRGPAKVTSAGPADLIVRLDSPRQTIEGFGGCFNELGWTALLALPAALRQSVIRELFAPGVGANLTFGRMPVGANDFSREWYSYDEVDGDFALEHFTIANDRDTLLPYIKSALAEQPRLRLWASPWSPPVWMKTNKHYAAALPPPGIETGIRPEQVGREGADMFVQDERYFRAYAGYFGRFVDEYRKEGIAVEMVMPQNEFNSAQVFPSCTWTAEGLARFLAHLGPEMAKRGVAVFFGTLEREDERLLEVSLADPKVAPFLRGAGFQWAGKGAIAAVRRRHPGLALYQTEQECGDGKNDWRYCRYAWTLLKHYLRNGASAYLYWNLALRKGGVSRWGWAQNSLVTVDAEAGSVVYNHEYRLLKHVSRFVRPGARLVETASWTGYDNALAFVNPDRSVVVVFQNDLCDELPIRIGIGDATVELTAAADSFNTVVLRS